MKEMIGYKILNDDLTCRDFKFDTTPGVVNHLGNDKPLVLCENGFHFCKHSSGVWSYYTKGRVFKIKAREVLDAPEEPGADFKLVCRTIEFIEEINIEGYRNTGYRNTGNRNTGYRNTGNRNTGNRNTGYRNTGNRNTGYRNTGDYNTGNYNTGYCNTGNRNTGDYNTGDCNTGDCNTGDYNFGDYWSGSLNHGEAPFYLFNKPVKGGREAVDMRQVRELYDLLVKDEPFDPTPFLSLPNASKTAIKRLHKVIIEARKKGTK